MANRIHHISHLERIKSYSNRFFESRYLRMIVFLIVICGAVLRVNYGIWLYGDISVADESSRLLNAYQSFMNSEVTLSIYDNIYKMIFIYGSHDLITAHFIMRIVASLISVCGMFLLLSSLRWNTLFSAFLASLVWGVNLFNIPFVQDYAQNLLCFGASCCAGALLISSKGLWCKIVGLGLATLAGLTRPEYMLVPAVFAIYYSIILVRCISSHLSTVFRDVRVVQLVWKICVVIVVCGVLLFAATNDRVRNTANKMEQYFFFGFSQCYANYIQYNRPEGYPPFHWGLDYPIVMKQDFPAITRLHQLLLYAPLKTSSYIVANALGNAKASIHLLDHRSLLTGLTIKEVTNFPWKQLVIFEDIILKGLAFLGMVMIGVFIFRSCKIVMYDESFRVSLLFLITFACAALPAFLIFIPRITYWITLVPLAYWGISVVLAKFVGRYSLGAGLCLVLCVFVCFSQPFFIYNINMKPRPHYEFVNKIRMLEQHVDVKGKITVLASRHQTFFNYPSKASFDIHNFSDLDLSNIDLKELIESARFSVIVIEYPLLTHRLVVDREVVEKFQLSPSLFGYRKEFRISWANSHVDVYVLIASHVKEQLDHL
jgi:hypothetical protein